MSMNAENRRLLTSPQTAEMLRIKHNTLEGWRVKGQGPIFRKVGRAVRYVQADVEAWLDQRARSSTGQPPSGDRGNIRL